MELYEQALDIAREIGDRRSEEYQLVNLGNSFLELGNVHKAIEYHEQALAIARELGDRSGEVLDLDNIGLALLAMENYQKASDTFRQTIQIADELSYPYIQNYGREGLATVHLFQNNLVSARTTIEAALQYDVPKNNHNVSALHGIIALRQGERETAGEAFARSIAQADEILAKTPDYYSALDAKGLALCGSALCADDGPLTVDRGKMIGEAVETFHAARKIAPHAGIVKRNLQLFDELTKCDEEGLLEGVREAVEGVGYLRF